MTGDNLGFFLEEIIVSLHGGKKSNTSYKCKCKCQTWEERGKT